MSRSVLKTDSDLLHNSSQNYSNFLMQMLTKTEKKIIRVGVVSNTCRGAEFSFPAIQICLLFHERQMKVCFAENIKLRAGFCMGYLNNCGFLCDRVVEETSR